METQINTELSILALLFNSQTQKKSILSYNLKVISLFDPLIIVGFVALISSNVCLIICFTFGVNSFVGYKVMITSASTTFMIPLAFESALNITWSSL